jgi:hypothetical protein
MARMLDDMKELLLTAYPNPVNTQALAEVVTLM